MFLFTFLASSVPLSVDLGAENMRATILTRQGTTLVHTAEGKKFTPTTASIVPNTPDAPVFFTDRDVDLFDRSVGDIHVARRHPKLTARYVPQLIGKNFTRKLVSYLRQRMITVPIDEDEEGYAEVIQPPEFFAAELLGKAITDSKRIRVNLTINQLAVIVPKFFTHHQRKAVVRAGKMATIKPILVDTTTALGYMFAAEKQKVFKARPQVVMFIDIGASQTQVSVQEFSSENNGTTVHELGYAWIDGVGGQAIDAEIGKVVKNRLLELQPDAEITDKVTENIMASAKSLKHMLTLLNEVNQTLEDLIPGFDFSFKITREDVNKIAAKHLKAVSNAIKKAINNSFLEGPEDIDRVELVGGASRIPNYVQIINKTLEGKVPLLRTMNPEEAAVNGASYFLASKRKNYLEKPISFTPCKIYNIVKKKLNNRRVAYFYKEKNLPIGINQFIMAVENLKDTSSAELDNGILVTKQCRKLTKSGLFKDKRYRVEALLTAFEKKEREQAEKNKKINEFESYLIETKDKLTKDSYIFKVATENERKRALIAIANAQYYMQTQDINDEDELKRMRTEIENSADYLIKAAQDARDMPVELEKVKKLMEEINNAVLDDFEEMGVQLTEESEEKLGQAMSRTEHLVKLAEKEDKSVSTDDIRIALERLRKAFETAKKSLQKIDQEEEEL